MWRSWSLSYSQFIYGEGDSVIRHWLRKGIGGWRLDVADELPDEFIKGIRAAMEEEAPDSVLLGEVWEDASNKESYGRQREVSAGGRAPVHHELPLPVCGYRLHAGQAGPGGVSGQAHEPEGKLPPGQLLRRPQRHRQPRPGADPHYAGRGPGGAEAYRASAGAVPSGG